MIYEPPHSYLYQVPKLVLFAALAPVMFIFLLLMFAVLLNYHGQALFLCSVVE